MEDEEREAKEVEGSDKREKIEILRQILYGIYSRIISTRVGRGVTSEQLFSPFW